MIQTLFQTNQRFDLIAALVSAAAIIAPFDISPVLSLLHIKYFSPLSVASLSLVVTLSGLFMFMRQYKYFSTASWIPAYALIISSTVAAAEVAQTPEETFFWFRMLGAFIGSSVAVNFRWRGGTARSLISMLAVGVATGFVSSRWIIDFFKWSNTSDYWMISSAIGGVLGYLLLKILFSAKAESAIKEKVGLND